MQKWTAGSTVVASTYSIGRDNDATNQMHRNVPTGASFEDSINDVAKMTLNSTGVTFAGTISGSNLSGANTGATATTLTATVYLIGILL